MDDVIDRTETLERVDGDTELLTELIDIFQEHSMLMISEIQSAVSREDAVRLRESAHSLKGSVGNFGAAKAYTAAARLEAIGERGDLSGAGLAFGVLEIEVQRVRNALASFVEEISHENTRCGR